MTNADVAEVLGRIASILEIQGDNPFRVRAYQTAARVIEGLEVPVDKLLEEGKLAQLPGIGSGIEEKIADLVRNGRMAYYEELRASVPSGLLEMLRIPALGPKRARALWKELGITTIAALEKACQAGKVASLKGFGARSQEKILEGIRLVRETEGRFLIGQALPIARRLLEHLKSGSPVKRAAYAGSLRRGKSIVKDVDLLASSDHPLEVIERFAKAADVREVLARGETKCSVRLSNGLQADLRVVADDEFASALLYFTGSKEHNVLLRTRAVRMGLTLNEYGLFKGKRRLDGASEEDLYRRLKLSYIPPELREARDELELAESDRIPQLLESKDIMGVLHVHSTWSDGTAEIEAMAEKARAMGLKWMGLSDHSKAAYYANGMDEARLKKQMKEVAALNRRWKGFTILHGLECDILPDGNLDLSEDVLGRLDFVIGSIHSRFDMPVEEMTARICKAIRNRHFDVFGHPTGRLLLDREGYKVDLEKVLQEARKAGKVVELNANPHRLDLDDAHARRAKELGVRLSIGPDAHSTAGLEDVEYGLLTARRAGLTARDVLNSRTSDQLRADLAGER